MKSIIHEIRRQPDHIKELATLLCTIIVVVIVGFVWFRSFQHNIYALLNPGDVPQAEERVFAQESKSLFSSIAQIVGDSKAQISSFFNGSNGELNVINNQTDSNTDKTHPLPVSGDR